MIPKTNLSPLLTVESLSKYFGKTPAVKSVHFEIYPGHIYGLLGPNGAGKTTTLRMIAGLLKPTSGRVHVCGHDPQLSPMMVKRNIGFLTGNTSLYQRITPIELLLFFGQLHMMSRKEIRKRIDQLVEELSLDEFSNMPCGTLSTGQKQRVNIARTLLHEPKLLVLDEPTSGLDLVSAEFILTTIKQCKQQGRAVLFSTHILVEAELLCDSIGVINHGSIAVEGSVSQLLGSTQSISLAEAFLKIIRTEKSGEK